MSAVPQAVNARHRPLGPGVVERWVGELLPLVGHGLMLAMGEGACAGGRGPDRLVPHGGATPVQQLPELDPHAPRREGVEGELLRLVQRQVGGQLAGVAEHLEEGITCPG